MSGLIPVAEALSRILASVARPVEAESVPLARAAGRVLAAPVASTRTQPPFPASAMDGYAVRAADAGTVGARLTLAGTSAAGHGFSGTLQPGEAVRIFTGAPVPEGADAILIQEDAEAEGDTVHVREAVEQGRFIRREGSISRRGRCCSPRHDPRRAPPRPGGGGGASAPRRAPPSAGGDPRHGGRVGRARRDAGLGPDRRLEQPRAGRPRGGSRRRGHRPRHRRRRSRGARSRLPPGARGEGRPAHHPRRRLGGRPRSRAGGARPRRARTRLLAGRPAAGQAADARPARGHAGDRPAGEPGLVHRLRAALRGAGDPGDARRSAGGGRPHRAGDARPRPAGQRWPRGLHARRPHDGSGQLPVATPENRQDSSMLAVLGRSEALLVRAPHAPPAKAGEPCRIIRLDRRLV